jgi:alkanesulfonate monooxygenase SsuD/methylene tetrahydromethanopterin reductase-like flavin-dependent oxidoreductase (luciferase family)
MDVGVARAFYVAKDAADKRKAVEARLANQQRMAKLADPSGTGKSSMLSFDNTLDAAEGSAMYGTPDQIANKLDALKAGGIEYVLLNGPAGSVTNLRRFAHEVMPAYAGETRDAAE